jgi:lipoprotein-releasing system permease protein
VLAAVPVILALGALALGMSLVLLIAFRFERFVGMRYLIRGRGSTVAKAGLVLTTIATAIGLGALMLGRGRSRELETVGVVLTLLGGLGLVLFLLLRVFSVFTTVSTMGVVLGVASLVVVLAVTSGFEREFQEKVLAVNAHLLVMSYGEPGEQERERDADQYMEKLRDMPGLKSMAKFTLSAGEVMIGKVGANVKGIDVAKGSRELERALLPPAKIEHLTKAPRCQGGTAAAAAASAPWVGRILLGEELAHRLRAKVGECISVLVPLASEDPSAEPAPFPFEVVGIFRMGFHEYDTRLAYVSLEDARRLGSVRGTLFGVELRFDDPYRALGAEPEVSARLGHEPRVINWRDLNNNLFTALQMQKVIIALFLVLIIVVAAFNIVASLTMIVLSKVREIAILAAMGARARALLRIFFVSGSLVGFVGVGLGLIYGLAVCGLATLYGYPLDPKVYLIAKLPVEISTRELLFVAGSTQLICMLATIYPALRASRLQVIEGLRYS